MRCAAGIPYSAVTDNKGEQSMKMSSRTLSTAVIMFMVSAIMALTATTAFAVPATITSVPGGGSWNVAGTWLIGGLAAGRIPGAADDVVIANTSSTVTVNANTAGLNSLTINNGSSLTVGAFALNVTTTATSATTINGTIIFNSATGTKTFNGLVKINSTGTWTETAGPAFTFNGGFQNDSSNTFTGSSGVHTFNGTNMPISGTNEIKFPSVSIGGTITNSGTLTVSTTLAGAGTLTNATTGILNFAGSSITPTLTANAGGNTVNYNGIIQTVKATTYSNLTLSNSGAKTLLGGVPPTSVAATLSIEGTAKASVGATLNLTVVSLKLGGLGRIDGTWGALAASTATYKTDTYFTTGLTGTLNVTGDNRTTPIVNPWPTASAITYQDTLSLSILSGGTPSTPGTFAFTSPTTAPSSAGNYYAYVTFTPTDTTSYFTVQTLPLERVLVIVNKKSTTITLASLLQEVTGYPIYPTTTTSPLGLGAIFHFQIGGIWGTTAPTVAGIYSVYAVIDDINYTGTSTTDSLTVSGDLSAPRMVLSMLADGAVTNNPVLNISGTVNDATGIGSFTINGVEKKSLLDANGFFNTAYLLKEGDNIFTFNATDTDTDQTRSAPTQTRTIKLDFAAPAVSEASLPDNSLTPTNLTTTTTASLSGVAETAASVDIKVNGTSIVPAKITFDTGTKIYSATVDLVGAAATAPPYMGLNTIEIIATDAGAKKGSIKRTIVSQSGRLTLQVTNPKEDVVSLWSPNTISGTLVDVDASIGDFSLSVDAGGGSESATIIGTTYQHAFNLPSATYATYPVKITALDNSKGIPYTIYRNIVYLPMVSLGASVASPQAQGASSITFTAGVPVGGPYEYVFLTRKRGTGNLLSITGNTYTVEQATSSNTFTWNTGSVAKDVYYVIVYVRDAATKVFVAKNYVSYTITESDHLTGVTLGADPPSPQAIGNPTPITFTAAGVGGTAANEYRFLVNSQAAQEWSTTDTFAWDTSSLAEAPYNIKVQARKAGSTPGPNYVEVSTSTNYQLVASPPATGVTLTPDVTSPQIKGATVTFTAVGTGDTGSFEYKFLLNTGGVWSVVQDYPAATDTYVWDTSQLAAGQYSLQVMVRNTGSTLPYEAYTIIPYSILANTPATGATLSASKTSPQVKGTGILLTAGASGGSGSYEYKFMVNTGGTWSQIQGYSTASTYTWTPATAGSYGLQVLVRNQGSSLAYEAYKTIPYTVLASTPASGATLAINVPSPQAAGTNVLLTAGVTSGSGTYDYKYMLNTGGAWSVLQDYPSTNTYVWNTTGLAAGQYGLQVLVRNQGSSLGYEAYKNIPYTVLAKTPATGATLVADKTSPQAAATGILLTAGGSGPSGSGPYEYRFMLNTGGTWSEVQPYSTTNTYTWTPATAGSYGLQVLVRNQGSSLSYEAYKSIPYAIKVP